MERNQKKTECQKKAGDAIEVSMEREADQNKKKEQEAQRHRGTLLGVAVQRSQAVLSTACPSFGTVWRPGEYI